MKTLPAAFSLLLPLAVAACGFTTEGTALRQFVKVEGGQAYDEGLINAEWFICSAASVGAIMRRYGQSEKTAAAWRALCLRDKAAELVIAPSGLRTSCATPAASRPTAASRSLRNNSSCASWRTRWISVSLRIWWISATCSAMLLNTPPSSPSSSFVRTSMR